MHGDDVVSVWLLEAQEWSLGMQLASLVVALRSLEVHTVQCVGLDLDTERDVFENSSSSLVPLILQLRACCSHTLRMGCINLLPMEPRRAIRLWFPGQDCLCQMNVVRKSRWLLGRMKVLVSEGNTHLLLGGFVCTRNTGRLWR